jgi:beta-glucosidase-like glycosyl hydrolase
VNRTGRLLFPALRWHSGSGFDHEAGLIESALRLGVGGFCIFGGEAPTVAALTAALQRRSPWPLLIASDLERGAGQQFAQATPLPPLAALGFLDDLTVTRAAASLTAREARALGVNWLFAPVADVDLEPLNPIVGTRAFGADPAHVAAHVAAWIEGCRAEGVLCCAKHFPGHGRTTADSHTALPRVSAGREALDLDLAPFRAAIAAGADSIMTAHVVYDALDTGTAATLSRAVLGELLRGQLGYTGIIVSDALVMEGLRQAGQGSEAAAAVAAVNAGCDALLYPEDVGGLADALAGPHGAALDRARLARALARIDRAATRFRTRRAAQPAGQAGTWGVPADAAWAEDVALRCIRPMRGAPRVAAACSVVTIDDYPAGPPSPPSRHAFPHALRELGIDVRTDAAGAQGAQGAARTVAAVYSDVRAWNGAPGLTARSRATLTGLLAAVPDAVIAFFGHPRLAAQVPGRHVLAAWGGERIMQRAAAAWLVRAAEPPASAAPVVSRP